MPKTLPVLDVSTVVCCTPMAAGALDAEAALGVALRLKALADPVRVQAAKTLIGYQSRKKRVPLAAMRTPQAQERADELAGGLDRKEKVRRRVIERGEERTKREGTK